MALWSERLLVKGSQSPALLFFSSAVQFAVAALGVVLTATFHHQFSARLDALSLPASERQAIDKQRAKLGLSRPMTTVNGTRGRGVSCWISQRTMDRGGARIAEFSQRSHADMA
jgi:hypothetical protein